MTEQILQKIMDGRTDLVFDLLAAGHAANASDANGVSLLQWCAYYGDVSALRYLQTQGASLAALGDNLDLNGAAFHGHWRLCQFLLENGADANHPLPDTGEVPLHAALCKANSPAHELVIQVLLANQANPNAVTKPGVETGGFMRNCRTKGETPLHRAAAFGTETVIQQLLDAGAVVDARDMHGDTPLSWASWYLRPASVLRLLCYNGFSIRPNYAGMDANLRGTPHE
jgi:ankyrin repeat protein